MDNIIAKNISHFTHYFYYIIVFWLEKSYNLVINIYSQIQFLLQANEVDLLGKIIKAREFILYFVIIKYIM